MENLLVFISGKGSSSLMDSKPLSGIKAG